MIVMKYHHDNNIKCDNNTTYNHEETIIKLQIPIISKITAIMHVKILQEILSNNATLAFGV